MGNNENIKKIYLGEELRNSVRLIKLGFGEIQNIGLDNSFYHLPLQLLSSGIERFLKCYICFGYYEKNNQFPDFNLLKKFGGKNGHDILQLKKVILKDYFQLRSEDDGFLKDDLVFIQNNKRLNELLYILSEFGKYARYHNLNIVTGNSNPSINSEKLWEEFETTLLKENSSLFKRFFKLENLNNPESYNFINHKIISILERFIRGLSRQFTFVSLGELAKQFSGEIHEFLFIKDENLGENEYRKITRKVIESIKKPYKRTLDDDIERDSNPHYHYKKIKKTEYKNDWPFLVDEVIVECRNKYWCIVTIEGYDYALNGNASDRYKLEFPQEGGMAKKGTAMHKFTKIAQNLDKN
ncbi:hypothetical protein [uncultured Aquimarina sp.]|uniref:hypothetical protein n=1 Tax=uncultured Aquimarina sp. TaxID=575652 RepID=UPI002623220A|nr:hypothetical protein [uncultured Aquimarina sp.]